MIFCGRLDWLRPENWVLKTDCIEVYSRPKTVLLVYLCDFDSIETIFFIFFFLQSLETPFYSETITICMCKNWAVRQV